MVDWFHLHVTSTECQKRGLWSNEFEHRFALTRTRAVNIRHFHIKDQIERGNVSIEHCHTDNMRSDCMSEGLQGIKFGKFGHRIMGFSGEEPKWSNTGKDTDTHCVHLHMFLGDQAMKTEGTEAPIWSAAMDWQGKLVREHNLEWGVTSNQMKWQVNSVTTGSLHFVRWQSGNWQLGQDQATSVTINAWLHTHRRQVLTTKFEATMNLEQWKNSIFFILKN